MTDEDALNLHLDLDPGDTLTRLILADLYEEEGRDEEAGGQRFISAVRKWPTFDVTEWPACHGRWDWWSYSGSFIPENSCVPSLFDDAERSAPQCRYDTRREAEADYLAHARRAGLLGKAVPA